MTSRRNFVIGAGTLLTGSGAFLGSGAFGVGNARNPDNWVPVGVRTPSSEGFESSLGLPQQGSDGSPGSDGGQGPGDGTGTDGTDGDNDSDGSEDGDGEGDGDDGGGDDGTDDSGDEDGEDVDTPDDIDNDTGGSDAGTDGGPADGGSESDVGTGGDGGDGDDGGGGSGPGGGTSPGGGGGPGGGSGGGGGETGGETSVRLEATGSEVLSSDHVLTAEDGTLRGLRLENLNMNALTYVGETSDGRFPNPDAGDRVAFLAVNDGDVAVDLSVDVAGTAPEVFNFPAWVDAAVSGPRQRDLTAVPVAGLPPGGALRIVVEVDTTVVDSLPDDAVEAVTFVADPV